MEKENTSEFGKGFIYNIVLFAKHWWKHFESFEAVKRMAERNPELWKEGEDDMWFNGAGDHFYELTIPEQFKDTDIGKLAKELQDEAIERRLCSSTKQDIKNFFDKLEKLCMMIDKHLGVEDIEADFS